MESTIKQTYLVTPVLEIRVTLLNIFSVQNDDATKADVSTF